MKILSAEQIRQADAYTIKHEPIDSVKLMDRAALACIRNINKKYEIERPLKIFCGLGNNGGDGLAMADILAEESINQVEVYIIRYSDKWSGDFLYYEKKLKEDYKSIVHYIKSPNDFPAVEKDDIIIDAIFGTGLNKPVSGLAADVIKKINRSGAIVFSVDVPSGLFTDRNTPGEAIIHAGHTLSFQLPKLAFMFSENENYIGEWEFLDIKLDKEFIQRIDSKKEYITENQIKKFLKPRGKFSHKGNYGHALLVAGSYGKMGAAVLAAKACIRTGAGLTTFFAFQGGDEIMQNSLPEVMVIGSDINKNKYDNFSAIGIGPGMGIRRDVWLKSFLSKVKNPLVLDADALNNISADKKLLKLIPANSILTPHPKEFARLAGESKNDFERHEMQLAFSKKYKVYVVLKGAHTCITTPEGDAWFNSTGNPGMAKGGSGDVLTGMITALLAQGYTPLESSLIGVYLHGLAGDIAAEEIGMDGMIASDIIDCIPAAWKKLREDDKSSDLTDFLDEFD